MTVKGKGCIAVLAIAAIAGYVFISNVYFFNPLLFRRNEITYLPWSWYKNPLQIEYCVLDEDGWRFTKSTDADEIRDFFRELQKGISQTSETPDNQDRASVWVAVRRLDDGVVLLALKGHEDGKRFMVQDNVPVQLSDSLRSLLQNRLSEARSSVSSNPPAAK